MTSATAEGPADGEKEILLVEGFAEVLAAGNLLSSFARGRVVVRGDEDDGKGKPRLREALPDVEAAQPRQLDIEDEAVDGVETVGGEQLLTRPEGVHVEARRREEPSKRAEDGGIVVDHPDNVPHRFVSSSLSPGISKNGRADAVIRFPTVRASRPSGRDRRRSPPASSA